MQRNTSPFFSFSGITGKELEKRLRDGKNEVLDKAKKMGQTLATDGLLRTEVSIPWS